ncbi:MAG: hypothetical protein QME74_10315 [Candidatus Edwardsbacteria bacterium]|nr:hypothetical protein [Candidatus Edwardsbacteria bacterium]
MHVCKAAVLHCIDFRLQKDLKSFLTSLDLLGACDVISIAGAVKSLVQGEPEEQAFVLKQIDTSVKLHAIREVYLINHTDCGAYGGQSAFDSPEAERAVHVTDLQNAKKLILAKHPNLKVELLIVRLNESAGVDFEKVG